MHLIRKHLAGRAPRTHDPDALLLREQMCRPRMGLAGGAPGVAFQHGDSSVIQLL